MQAAEMLTRWISEPLTWAELCARYPDQWVCLVEMDRIHPDLFDFRTARVIGHGKTRREPVDQALAWRDDYELIGHYFTGKITVRPPRPSVVLDDEMRDIFFGHPAGIPSGQSVAGPLPRDRSLALGHLR